MSRMLIIFVLAVGTLHAETPQSIYNIQVPLTDQSGNARDVDLYRGHPVLVSMFYSSCPMACPLIIDTMRSVERALPVEHRDDLRVLLISIDPERDTPAALQALANERHIDTSRWTLARTDAANVRKVAALLGIQYRKMPDGEFSHSSVITVLDRGGEIRRQSSMLAKADPEVLTALERVGK